MAGWRPGDILFRQTMQLQGTGTRNVQLSATLALTSGGSPVSGASISFQYMLQGASAWTQAGSATTNSSGVASVTVTLTAPDTYVVEATFAGTASYAASTSNEVTESVTPPPAPTTLTLTVTEL
jgi:hypothetical protein